MTDIHWSIQGQLAGWIDRGGFRFVTAVNEIFGQWQALGIVTPTPGPAGDTLRELFDDHRHCDLGSFGGLEEARRKAERFLLEAPLPSERCECKEAEGSESRASESPDAPLERSAHGITIRFDTAVVTLEGVLPPGFSGPVGKSVQDLFRPLEVVLDGGARPEARGPREDADGEQGGWVVGSDPEPSTRKPCSPGAFTQAAGRESHAGYCILLAGQRYHVRDVARAFVIDETAALTVGGFVAVWLENFGTEPAPFRVRLRGHGGRSHPGGDRPPSGEEVGSSSVWLGMIAGDTGASSDSDPARAASREPGVADDFRVERGEESQAEAGDPP